MKYYSIVDIDTGRYWQCDHWVVGMNNATKYFRIDDANNVVALRFSRMFPRGGGAVDIVENDTAWRSDYTLED